MKSILMLFLAGILAFEVSGQAVNGYCWDFEQSCIQPRVAFILGCIPNATSSHGSPGNDTRWDTPPASNGGSRYATMYAQQTGPQCEGDARFQGEGILLSFNFVPNKTYKISLLARQSDPGTSDILLRLMLVNNMPTGYGSGSMGFECNDDDIVPPVPPGSWNVTNISGTSIPHTSWGSFSQTITPTVNFNQLWICPLLGGDIQDAQECYVDNVCIEEVECPNANFTVSRCKVEDHSVRTTVNPPSSPGAWQLFHALDCNGGTGANNIGAPATLNWLDPAQTMFDVGFSTGCYILQFTATTGNNGCPPAIFRVIIDSGYGGKNTISGDFDFYYLSECAYPTYQMWFYPLWSGSFNGTSVHHWALFDVSNPSVPIATWDNEAYIY
ncbi:MAG: hypothetical protein JNK89_09250, partial [Saprospiraceae bacterium]|nr:hypothetical protein [Saprospiraceae bacterium]